MRAISALRLRATSCTSITRRASQAALDTPINLGHGGRRESHDDDVVDVDPARFVRTNIAVGLTDADVDRAIAILRRTP